MSTAQEAFEHFYVTELLSKTPRAADTNKVLRDDDVLFRLQWDGAVWTHTQDSETIYPRVISHSGKDMPPLAVADFIAQDPWQNLLKGEPAFLKIEFADPEKTLLKSYTLRIVN